jgi:hypothetical protein
MTIPKIRPPIKYLNSMIPSCPFLSIPAGKSTTYINVFRKIYKWRVKLLYRTNSERHRTPLPPTRGVLRSKTPCKT